MSASFAGEGMDSLTAPWPAIPEEVIRYLAGPVSTRVGMPEIIEPCPVCRGRDIRYTRRCDGMRCSCMSCQRRGQITLGPPASDILRGSTPAETMWLRRDEAYRLWNIVASIPHSPTSLQAAGEGADG